MFIYLPSPLTINGLNQDSFVTLTAWVSDTDDNTVWLYYCGECQALHNQHFYDPKDDDDQDLSTCPAQQRRNDEWWDTHDEDSNPPCDEDRANVYTEQNYRTDIANTTPSQAGYEYVVRLGENNGWSSDAIRKIIDQVWDGRAWVGEEEMAAARTKHIRKMIRQEEEYQDRKRIYPYK